MFQNPNEQQGKRFCAVWTETVEDNGFCLVQFYREQLRDSVSRLSCFEYTFELAWKTMKDYLEEQGYDIKSPRTAIQTAFQAQLVKDGHIWIDALEKRNLMAHTYDENRAIQAEKLIRTEYYQMLKELYFTLEGLQ